MAKPRIPIPTNPGDIIKLAASIEAQHDELDKTSPLSMLDWEDTSPQIKEATAVQDKVDKMGKELEKLTQRRNNLVAPLGEFVRSARDVLSGVYRAEMKKLGDFGFRVDDSHKAKKNKPNDPPK